MFHPVSNTCMHLVRQGQQFDPVYGNGLSNHLPMALTALACQGASDEQLTAFYHRYIKQLNPLRPANDLGTQHPRQGNPADFGHFLSHYRQQIRQQGLEPTVREALAQRLPGLITAAFHGVIRLSYAVALRDNEEVALALAYWASEYQTLGPLEQTDEYDAQQQLQLAQQQFADFAFQPGIITDRVDELSRLPAYQRLAAHPATLSFEQVARITIRYYLASDNFVLLHGVTGFQALHRLLPYLDDPELALRYYWQAYVAAMCVARTAQGPVDQASCPAVEWEHWHAQSCRSRDDHTIKLIYSASYLYQHFPWPEYPAAIKMRLAKEAP
ncbi:questin oxidase family protein [Photobacterium atrarenae]|uniref:Questin oxidase family protein n=1 Tax=Photobacterium atrarenae TaxID=865757 RepID=A0ABY5GDY3_9GAMM|nr:questin oxidase family protein [Photobacterium atrarenae]UTV27329.1 questin oxidase family protein [Photobacterium atrarenae]